MAAEFISPACLFRGMPVEYHGKKRVICRRKLQSGPITLHEMFIDSSIDLCSIYITSLACNVASSTRFSAPLRG